MKGKKLHVLLMILIAIFIFLFTSTTACGQYKSKANEVIVEVEQVANNVNAEEGSDKDNNENDVDKKNGYENEYEYKEEGETGDIVFEESAEGESHNEKSDKEYFLNLVVEFFNAVKEDTEYSFFSNATVELVGSEEEYKNGIKTDLYFIIKEGHSNWESIEIGNLGVDSDKAIVTIIGDRTAEGTKYENESVDFKFVKENEEWKIDFSY